MKITTTLILGLTALVSTTALLTFARPPSPPTTAGQGQWLADFDQAAALARKEGKNVLVDFTGSDWCGWCIRLHKEVFDHEEFLVAAKKNFVLTALDFPRAEALKAKVPNPRRNEELKSKYEVSGFPTILLLTPDGELLGRTGYEAGGPKPYVASLEKMLAEGKAALAPIDILLEQHEAAGDDEKDEVLMRVVTKLEQMAPNSTHTVRLLPLAHAASTSKNTALRERATLVRLSHDGIDAALVTEAMNWDPANESGYLSKLAAAVTMGVKVRDDLPVVLTVFDKLDALGPIADPRLATDVYFMAAFWLHNFMEDTPKAKRYAAKAVPFIKPGDDRHKVLQVVLDA
ncbi:MAG: thiol-disulfide isomerase/thioredoxin [Planctomycetota bacterium]|jgi:thiol-disulfide isomerase/thioredoxin